MSQKLNAAIAAVGIDIGKNSFHVVGHDERGAIVSQRDRTDRRQRVSSTAVKGHVICVLRMSSIGIPALRIATLANSARVCSIKMDYPARIARVMSSRARSAFASGGDAVA